MTSSAEPIRIGPSVVGWAEGGIEPLSPGRFFAYNAHFNAAGQAVGFPASAEVIEISPVTLASRVFESPKDADGNLIDDVSQTETLLTIDWQSLQRGVGIDNIKDPTDNFFVQIGERRGLSPIGVEAANRMFDAGYTRYKIAKFLGMSFGAIKYRHTQWVKAGGRTRQRPAVPELDS
jgi:hypothetical protein